MRRKFVGFIFVILILIGGSLVFRLWNKPPERVEAVRGETISVDSLCSAFDSDESAANKRFLNKAINITGQVEDIIHNLEGGIMIVMKDTTSGAEVQCAFREKNISLKKGSMVTVKGFCSGKTITGVSLTDCILIL